MLCGILCGGGMDEVASKMLMLMAFELVILSGWLQAFQYFMLSGELP